MKVTGNLADALNWSSEAAVMFSKYMSEDVTTAEDAFNVALSECTTEQERQQLITETLTALYGGAADKYRDTASSVIEANEATADFTLAQADMGEKIEPITTSVKDGFADVLGAVLGLTEDTDFEAFSGKVDSGFDTLVNTVIPAIKNGFQWILDNWVSITVALAAIVAGFIAFNIASIIQGVTTALTTLRTIILGVNAAMAANPIGLIITAIGLLVAAFIYLWNNCEGFRNFFIGMWEKIKEATSAAVEWVKNAVENIKTKFIEIKDAVVNKFLEIKQAIHDKIEEIKTTISNAYQAVKDWFNQLWIVNFIREAAEIIRVLLVGLWEIIKAVFAVVAQWFDENVIQPVSKFFTDLWNGIKNAAKTAWDFIVGVWSAVSGWFNTNIIQPVSNFFSNMWQKLKNGASDAWQGIKNVFGKVADFFGEKFGAAWQKVKDIFSTGGKVFDGIKDGIESTFKRIVNRLIRGINRIVAVPFNAINNALDKIRNVEVVGLSPFTSLPTITVPEIPELARGGVLKEARHIIAGEDGAEAIVPLERNTEWIDRVADKLADKQKSVVVNQTNNYSQAHSRYELYKTKKQTAAAVRAALAGV